MKEKWMLQKDKKLEITMKNALMGKCRTYAMEINDERLKI